MLRFTILDSLVTMSLAIREDDDSVTFAVRVAPRASREAIVGLHGEALKVALTAPPVDGAANAALVKLLSKKLGIPKRDIAIISGTQSRDKLIRAATSADVVRDLLGSS